MKRLTRRWSRQPRPGTEEKNRAASFGRVRGSAPGRSALAEVRKQVDHSLQLHETFFRRR